MLAATVQLLRKYKYQIALFVAGLAVALSFGWWAWNPPTPKPETYKEEIKQPDGSVVLEKKPDPNAKPAQDIPKGAKLIRKATITVQAKVPTATISGSMTVETAIQYAKAALPVIAPIEEKSAAQELLEIKEQECLPVTVDLSLVEMPDKSQRVVASSPDGNILGGVDIPVRNAEPQPEPKLWAVGAAISSKQNLGVWIDRDLGFLRLGAEINTTGNDIGVKGVEAWGKIGIRF